MSQTKQTSQQQKGLLTVRFDQGRGGELQVEVSIVNTRKLFGRTEYLVTPVAGSGECWKSAENIKLL